jgi:predicted N-formylglutamate amidohydrolase
LPPDGRRHLLEDYYRPYRQGVAAEVCGHLAAGASVLHVSVHTFTRRLGGDVRNADVGLLYDPSRAAEKSLCRAWQKLLAGEPGLRVRRNYPYRGVADGLVTSFRRHFATDDYVGVELEVCQDIFLARGSRWHRLTRLLAGSLMILVGSVSPGGQ